MNSNGMHLHEWINFTSFVLQLSLKSGADAVSVENYLHKQ